MCGIFGLISNKKDLNVAEIIRKGLERMEYRGYDSAGIALVNNGNIELRKKAGRIADINKDGWFDTMPGQFGVGHTRWATHGPPIHNNSHPHMDCTEKIALVHNGIIENYQELRAELTKRGHILLSETDTEVFPHLIEDFRKKGLNLKDAVIETVKICKGAYGVVVCDANCPEYMVVARKESPLVIGITPGETCYCGSDIPAFLPFTRNAIILDDNEVAVLYPGKCEIFKVEGGEQSSRDVMHIEYTMEAAQKVLDGKEFKWFMHKEMHEIPRKIIDQVKMPQDKIDIFAKSIIEAKQVFITAAGTAFYAALAGKFQITRYGGPNIHAVLCSELIDLLPNIPANSLLIAVSQSGETADTIEAVRYAREKFGTKICSIVNVVGSSLTRYSDHVIITTAGPEIAVASQKAFCTQITALTKVAFKIGELTNTITKDEAKKYDEALLETANVCSLILQNELKIFEIAKEIAYKSNLYFLARGISVAAANEGALKLKEIAYIHTESYAAGESKHGPIALIEEGFPCIFIAPPDSTYNRIIGNIMEMKSRGATIISVVAEFDKKVTEISHFTIRVPLKNDKYSIETSIIPFTLPLQILAYFVSDYKGFDPDKPKNLAKSVTVK